MMTLVAAGKISLDDSANKYLGDMFGLKGNGEGATIRLLGGHAAGLPSMVKKKGRGKRIGPNLVQLFTFSPAADGGLFLPVK